MMFLFKKKDLHIDVFTQYEEINTLFPVDYTYKFYPSWWKKLPVEYEEPGRFWPTSTMRRCPGFIDYYKNSIGLPLWCDVAFNVTSQFVNWQFSDPRFEAQPHPAGQMQGYLDPTKYHHIKLISPWYFRCKEDINFVWSSPTWNADNPSDYFAPPAVINYKYNFATNVNMFLIAGDQEKKFIIPSGRPLAFMHPLTEKTLKIHRHVVSSSELDKIKGTIFPSSFTNKYSKVKNILKQNEEKKCPFGFSKK